VCGGGRTTRCLQRRVGRSDVFFRNKRINRTNMVLPSARPVNSSSDASVCYWRCANKSSKLIFRNLINNVFDLSVVQVTALWLFLYGRRTARPLRCSFCPVRSQRAPTTETANIDIVDRTLSFETKKSTRVRLVFVENVSRLSRPTDTQRVRIKTRCSGFLRGKILHDYRGRLKKKILLQILYEKKNAIFL